MLAYQSEVPLFMHERTHRLSRWLDENGWEGDWHDVIPKGGFRAYMADPAVKALNEQDQEKARHIWDERRAAERAEEARLRAEAAEREAAEEKARRDAEDPVLCTPEEVEEFWGTLDFDEEEAK